MDQVDNKHNNCYDTNSRAQPERVQVKSSKRLNNLFFNLCVAGVAVKVGDTLEPIPIIIAVPSQVETDNHDHYFKNHIEYVSANR